MEPQEPPSTPKPQPAKPAVAPIERERYIRTFEGDINVVSRGGTPGLTPLRTPPPMEPTPLPEARPESAGSLDVPPPQPLPDLGQKLRFEPEPRPAPMKAARPEAVAPTREATADAQPLETYANDFRQHMQETHASTATVLAAEQDAGPHAEPEPEQQQEPERHTLWYVAGGVLLALLGGAGVFYAYSNYLTTQTPVALGPIAVAPIFVDSTEPVSGNGATLLQAVVQAAKNSQPANSVRLLSLTSASTTNVFLSIGVPVPGILVRNITDSGNMAGIVNIKGVQSPFFIESVELYSATFSGMLLWEPTMQGDLSALYPLYPAAPVQTPATASSTASSTPRQATATPTAAKPVQSGFRDEVVGNHDVRTYRDSQGRSILTYGYWNQKTLVIARDPDAFAEILDRLATSHAQ